MFEQNLQTCTVKFEEGDKKLLSKSILICCHTHRDTYREQCSIKTPTLFPGPLVFPSPGAREERPWLGLVTCLPEKNKPERRVVCCPIFLAYYFCQIQIKAYSIRSLRKATAMFLSCLQFAICKSSYSNVNLKVIQVKCLEAIYIRRDVVAVLPTRYGKSLIFQLLPSLLHRGSPVLLRSSKQHLLFARL